jgi:hypothetical protein
VAIYLDVEGVPDRDFYYLIGLLVVEQGRIPSPKENRPIE